MFQELSSGIAPHKLHSLRFPRPAYCKMRSLLMLILLIGSVVSCTDPGKKEGVPDLSKVSNSSVKTRIVWDEATLTRIYGQTPSFYPRMSAGRDGDLLTVFESEGAILLTRSRDNGVTWTPPVAIAPPDGVVQSTVPDILRLGDNELLVAYNTRPPRDNRDENLRFGIQVIKSGDEGETWSDPVTVYEGGFEWTRGVWEPFMMKHNDEILLFFANEHPYADSHDQEISMTRSTDSGESWSEPVTVSYRAGSRDGMPVPVILKESGRVAVAIEDNGMHGNEFKPAIIGFGSVDDLGSGYVGGDTAQRWRALKEEDQLEEDEYGGAPFLVQLPGGETILSFQTTKGREVEWSRSTMAVAVGNENAESFSLMPEPFPMDSSSVALWGSLFVKNDSTVTALTSTDGFNERGVREIVSIDGMIRRSER